MSEEEEEEVADNPVIMMPGHELITSSRLAGGDRGHVDGPIADARFQNPCVLLRLPDGGILVGDGRYIRKISPDLQEVTTVAGDGTDGYRDGAAAQARFRRVRSFLLMPDNRVLVADRGNHRLRMLSADLQQVIAVAGTGVEGHRDGAAAQASQLPLCSRLPSAAP